jgi:hypothetical protein
VLRLILVFVALFFVSCGYGVLKGFPMSTVDQESTSFFVLHQPNDNRALDEVLSKALRSRGFRVEIAASESPDYLVNYIDKWYWDMRTYMVDVRVDIRDAETNMLVGTGRSFQASLDAMGHSYAEVIESALDAALTGNLTHVSKR